MRRTLTLILLSLSLFILRSFGEGGSLPAQDSSTLYHFNYPVEVPVTAAAFVLNYFGQQYLLNLPPLDTADIIGLGPEDVPWFDRSATLVDPAIAPKAIDQSDLFLFYTPILPGLLLFDRKVRKDWLGFLFLYVETHSVNNDLYYAGVLPVRRKRPLVFNPRETLFRKLDKRTTDSFFSGHTSVTATSSFFMAKVFIDHHPELKTGHRVLLYSLAAFPPAFVGWNRYRAGKHFLSDIALGFAIGAATGILVPELHKGKNRKAEQKVTWAPVFSDRFSGLAFRVKL